MEQKGLSFVPPHNLGDYPQSMDSAQEQALGTEKFWQNKVLFWNYTAVDRSLKKQIVTEVEPVFLPPLVDQLPGFVQVSALDLFHHIFTFYGAIDEINLKENAVKMMDLYHLAKPLARLIKILEKGR